MKIKSIFKKLFIILLVLVPFVMVAHSVRADSGWDTDYDSGSSWDSGSSYDSGNSWDSNSSYDSGSSWDSDSSYDSDNSWDSNSSYDSGSSWNSSSSNNYGSYNHSNNSSGGSYHHNSSTDYKNIRVIVECFLFVFIFVVIFVIAFNIENGSKIRSNFIYTYGLNNLLTTRLNNSPTTYNDVSEKKIKDLLPDMDLGKLKNIIYNKFVEVQIAWMNFEYDELRNLCTDELYNSYIAQLDTLKIKNGQNIMSNFVKKSIRITDIANKNENIIVTVFLRVSFFDYVINTNTKEIIRGQKNHKITNNYIMTFVRSKKNTNKQVTCPNCGAPSKVTSSGTCEHCGSAIVRTEAADFVLSTKTNVNK